jgi:hypothetical protein
MGVATDTRASIAGQIIAFADEREDKSLHRDKNRIVSEFDKLKDRIDKAAPRNKTGKGRAVTSLTSKALWCCYPNDVPIFDRNAVSALGVISRVCHLAPGRNQSEYAGFVDVWFRVYNEVESVIGPEDMSVRLPLQSSRARQTAMVFRTGRLLRSGRRLLHRLSYQPIPTA